MKIKKMFSVTLALALLLQIFALALPVSAETVDETDTSSTGAATEAIDLKKQIVPQSEVPALIDYSVAVENKYTCRAYHMETDLNQVVFLKADGSYDTYLFAFPVKYVDENGEVRDKAPELTYNASPTAGKYRMTTTSANDNALFCADVASDGLLYTSDALSLSLRPTTAAEHAFALQIALANSDAELQSIGNAVASSLAVIGPVTQAPAGFSAVAQSDFASSALNEGLTSRAARYALSNEAALSVVPSYNGFQVALGLAKNRTQNTYTFALSTGDATLVNQEGTILLVNDEGDPLGIVGEFILVDENGTCGTVAPQVTKVTDGEYLLSADLGDDALVATLSVSQYYDYLQDATIYQANQTSYGSSSRLFVGTLASSSVLGRALIRPNNWYFTSTAYPGYEVQSATLHIRDVMGDDPEVNVEVRPFTGNTWVESTATWNSVGGNSYGAVLDTKTVSPDIGWDASPRYWYQYNITSLVRNWYNGTANPAKGLMIKGDAANEARSDVTEKTFASSQYSNESLRPYITVTSAQLATVSSGIYYIKNVESGTYLTTDHTSHATTNVTHNSLTSGAMYQMWRVVHMQNGYYTIRPYHYTPNGLTVTSSYDLGINLLGYSDLMEDVPSYSTWHFLPETDGTFQIESYGTTGGLSNFEYMDPGYEVHFSDLYGDSYEYWEFEPVSNAPLGIFFYNTDSGVLNTSVQHEMPYSEDAFLCDMLDIGISTMGSIDPNDYTWSSSDPQIASVDNTLLRIYSHMPGVTTVGMTLTSGNVSVFGSVQIVVQHFSAGTYHIQNRQSSGRVDIENQSMQNGTTIHQWTEHSGDSAKWVFEWLPEGYYAIRSVTLSGTGTKYYLGVQNDSSSDLAPVVLRTGAITDGMKWKVEFVDGGGYKIIPKVGEAYGRALAVEYSSSNQSENGLDIKSATYSNDTYYSDVWFIQTLETDLKDALLDLGIIDQSNITATNDGMYIIDKPISEILFYRNILSFPTSNEDMVIESFYSRWYLYWVVDENNIPHYSMYTLRMDGDVGDKPAKVTISFISLNSSFLNCLNAQSEQNRLSLRADFVKCVEDGSTSSPKIMYDTTLQSYFDSPNSDGAYLIADLYIDRIVETYSNGSIVVPQEYKKCLAENEKDDDESISRHKQMIDYINASAGKKIYDKRTESFCVENVKALTIYEKWMILVLFCGNSGYHSFAAEVDWHAAQAKSLYGLFFTDTYYSAVRADMTTIDHDTGLFNATLDYYDMDSALISAHEAAHPEYPVWTGN